MRKLKILITGANGFIGQALCKRILSDGYKARVAVRNATQIKALPSGIEGVQVGDVDSETDWSEALSGIEEIVHLAARVHIINDTASDPLTAFRWVNVKGTEHLAQTAAASGCRRFVFMSSIKVNGEGTEAGGQKSEVRYRKAQLKMAFSENDNPEPRDAYGISKWEAEQVLQEIAEATGLEVVILRPPLVYGSGVKANFLRLMRAVACGVPLPVSNVNNRISLIYKENLVDAVFTCLSHPKAAGQTYLVSDGEDVSTPELIRRISSAMGKPARLFPFPPFFLKMAGIITGKSVAIDKLVRSLTIDCSKIRRDLDWQAPFSMDQGLRETAMWYLKRRNISRKGAKTLR